VPKSAREPDRLVRGPINQVQNDEDRLRPVVLRQRHWEVGSDRKRSINGLELYKVRCRNNIRHTVVGLPLTIALYGPAGCDERRAGPERGQVAATTYLSRPLLHNSVGPESIVGQFGFRNKKESVDNNLLKTQ
jgi:hypothetical protein